MHQKSKLDHLIDVIYNVVNILDIFGLNSHRPLNIKPRAATHRDVFSIVFTDVFSRRGRGIRLYCVGSWKWEFGRAREINIVLGKQLAAKRYFDRTLRDDRTRF